MVKDHKVRRRYADEIKVLAEEWRRVLCAEDARPDFNVTECVRLLTRNKWIRSRDTGAYSELKLKFFRQGVGQPPAYVGHNPTVLNCDKEIWEEADSGYPYARFVIAHELCHVLLHDHYAQPFTDELKKTTWQVEESGEWQANMWGDYFLVSDADICNYVTPSAIAIYCSVERDVALRRLGPGFNFSGESCPECGNFTLVRSGTCFKCDTCGMIACS